MVAEKEKQKIQKLVEMGKRAHMLAREGQLGDPELVAMSGQLVQLDAEVNAHLGKKRPNREDGVCPQCSAAFEGTFCGGCGLNIDEFFSKPVLVCTTCEFLVEESDVFCGVCGSKLPVKEA